MMPDLESQLRRALGEPPSDPRARERALVRLRAQMMDPVSLPRRRQRRRELVWRVGAAVLVAIIGIASLFGTAAIRRPAAAGELDRLAERNVDWASSGSGPTTGVQVVQEGLEPHFSLDGGSTYTLVVRSLITLSLRGDSVEGTQEVLDRKFYTPADRENWENRGSPPLPQEGRVETYRSEKPYYDVAAISADPGQLRTSLEDGSVAGYLPNQGQLFELIASLLVEPTLGPDQRRALYEVVASLDGVELLGDIPDPLGRTGIGFSYQDEASRQVLIFDRETGQPLAFEEYSSVDPTQRLQWQAFDPPAR